MLSSIWDEYLMNTEPSEQILRASWLERKYLALRKVRFAMKCRKAMDTFSRPGEVAAVRDGAKNLVVPKQQHELTPYSKVIA